MYDINSHTYREIRSVQLKGKMPMDLEKVHLKKNLKYRFFLLFSTMVLVLTVEYINECLQLKFIIQIY